MFETIKNEAIEAKSALANLEANTVVEQKDQIEKTFVEKVKARQDAIATAEKANDATKNVDLTKSKIDFVEFQKDYTTEMKALLEDIKKEVTENTEQNSNDLSNLAAEINNDKTIDLTTLSGKSRPELWQTPGYISKIQEIILQTWAKHTSISENKLKDGIFWPAVKAGIKTIQNYINETYSSNLVPDGIPGENTLAALLSPVSDSDTTSRLDKMLSEKPTFTKIFEITQNENNSSKDTNKEQSNNNREETKKEDNSSVDIDQSNKEIPPKIISAKTQELKKNFPQFIEFQKKTDQYFVWKRAKAIIENWEKRKEYQKILKNRIENQKKNTSEKKENKPIRTSENVSEKSTIDENILTIARKELQNKLQKKIFKDFTEQNIIKFEWKNSQQYENYYKKYILDLNNTKKNPSLNVVENYWQNTIINIHWSYYYNITLQPSDFIKKGTYEVNFNSVLETIKKDIITKVDNNIKTKKLEQERIQKEKEKEKLQKKYDKLKEYLENQNFTMNYLYKKEEQVPLVKAFFEDFSDGIDFNNGDSEFLEKSKKIKVEFENNWWNKYWTWTLPIEDKFNTDGSLNKEKIKQELRRIVDYKIKNKYPTYQINQVTSQSSTSKKNQYNE